MMVIARVLHIFARRELQCHVSLRLHGIVRGSLEDDVAPVSLSRKLCADGCSQVARLIPDDGLRLHSLRRILHFASLSMASESSLHQI